MVKFTYEVVVHGRINITVEAETEQEAETALYDSPDYPDFDKLYMSDHTLVDSTE